MGSSRHLLVLGWHAVDATWSFSGDPDRRRALFADQLRLLDRWATVLSLPDALARLDAGELPPRSVVLTFDDGYADVPDGVVPALAQHGMPATFFLVPEFLDGGVAWWEDLAAVFRTATVPAVEWQGRTLDVSTPERRRRAHQGMLGSIKDLTHVERVAAVARLRERLAPTAPRPTGQFASWDDASGLLAAGHTVGSHTTGHAILARETPADQLADLAGSRATLSARLGIPVDTLAYPNGTTRDFDDATREAARAAGYRCALTTAPGLAGAGSPFALRRVVVDPTTDLRSLAVRGVSMARNRLRRRIGTRLAAVRPARTAETA